MSRREEFQLLLLISAVYMSYSAYYFSFGLQTFKTLTEVSINLLYLLLSYLVLRNCYKLLRILGHHIRLAPDESPLMEALMMKRWMLRGFFMVSTTFFSYEIFMHSFMSLIHSSEKHNSFITIVHMTFEYLLVCFLMWVFRPREWPEYFGLEVNNQI